MFTQTIQCDCILCEDLNHMERAEESVWSLGGNAGREWLKGSVEHWGGMNLRSHGSTVPAEPSMSVLKFSPKCPHFVSFYRALGGTELPARYQSTKMNLLSAQTGTADSQEVPVVGCQSEFIYITV